MSDTKLQIWVATTIIVFVVFISDGHWFLALLSLVASYFAWIAKSIQK